MAIITYEDALNRLKRFLGGTTFARADEDCKLAVLMAYEGITQSRNWHYYNGIWGFNTNAPVESTATYVHSTRKITMATATPSWVLSGAISMDGIVADIETLNTASNPSVIVMGTDRNFGQNYSTSTSLTLFQEHVVLPDNYRNIKAVVADQTDIELSEITPSDYVRMIQYGGVTGDPQYYAIMQDPENLGRTALFLYPAPSAVRTYRIHYQKKPRDLWYSGTEDAATDGTVTITTATAAVTGSSTAFESRMAGSVMRLTASTQNVPTDQLGSNPYTEQKIIQTYTSATALTLDSVVSQGYSGTRFTISDPIDIDPVCIPAFYARCRLELARLRTDTHLRDQLPYLVAESDRLFDDAASPDVKMGLARRTGHGGVVRDWTRLRYTGDTGM